jgi:hypothetical protein
VKSEANLAAEVQSAAFLGLFFSLRKRMNRETVAKKRIKKMNKKGRVSSAFSCFVLLGKRMKSLIVLVL